MTEPVLPSADDNLVSITACPDGPLLVRGPFEILTSSGEVIPPRDLRPVTRAVNYDGYAGVIVDECSEGGDSVAFTEGGRIRYDDVELPPGISFFECRASSAESAKLEVRVGGPDGPVAGSCEMRTGGKQRWMTFRCAIEAPAGRGDGK